MIRYPLVLTLALSACAPAMQAPESPAPAPAQSSAIERPIPYPIELPASYRAAVERGTRTEEGAPGPRYWNNRADYDLHARLLPDQRRLEGSASIRYHNRSPDVLDRIILDLTQNFHAPGALRLEPAEVTGGIELRRVAVRGQNLSELQREGPGYIVQGTKMAVVPSAPVRPGETVDLQIDWAFDIPQAGIGGRMGYSGEDLFYVGYWFPQVAVYDDVEGWATDPFLGTAEFYSDFGTYSLTVEAPAGWVVAATGEHTNREQVLAPAVLDRLRIAEQSDTVVQVLGPAEFASATRPASGGLLRWTFVADSVRDVAFSATRRSIWDATRTPVGDRNGDGALDYAMIHAFYREPAFRWREVARYEQHAIRFLSESTGVSYPWPHMTAVEGAGIIGGGMEFPMMTIMGDYTAAGDEALYNVTAHELAHMWVPLTVSINERRFGWLDEGITTFNENQARKDIFPGAQSEEQDAATYLNIARRGMEGEMMRRSDYHYPGPSYVVASYAKPATVLATLRGLIGEDTFNRAMREFYDRWAWKHAYPWDFFRTVEDVAGEDLDWFWRVWYYETWVLDQAIDDVREMDGRTVVTIRDIGDAPMPARVTITFTDGRSEQVEVPVGTWLRGARTATVEVPGTGAARVEIDAAQAFPDADRENNVWLSDR